MPMPKSVKIGSRNFKVKLDAQLKEDGEDSGECDFVKGIISIQPKTSLGYEQDTLWHEIGHAVWYGVGMKDRSKDETVMKRFMPLLLDVLKTNPKLVNYLLEEE